MASKQRGAGVTIAVRSGGLITADDEGAGELLRLRSENDILRKMVSESDADCIYCGLTRDDMAKCPYGFPGCARADDLLI